MTHLDPAVEPVSPFLAFRFRVKWQDRYVAGVTRVGPLRRTTQVVVQRDAGDPSSSRKLPGHTDYEPITIELGVIHDREFEQWAASVVEVAGAQAPPAQFRRDIRIEVCDEAGHVRLAYDVFGCWISSYQALPDLDVDATATALQHATVENEGWERDYEVPDEPTTTPADPPG